ncbi:MAG TPA: helix-turn-helix domain-containing protein [Candidatus Acetothermia bacterium]|nr:helix-turn-helix domain-containing protein [Candidatus Acetothermia bacterium]
MRSPCEIIIWYVLPRIRSELAKELVNLGLPQKEVAKRLGITQPAVSQYLREKRGRGIEFKENVMLAIRKLAKDLADDVIDNLIFGVCEICTRIREDKTLCRLHKEQEIVPEDCNLCLRKRYG